MRYSISILMCAAFAISGAGQYTYFNIVDGVEGDDDSEGVTNCEFLGDSFYVWGGGIINGSQEKLLRNYSTQGDEIDENWLQFLDNYIYSGTTNSFQRIPGEDNFLVSHALIDASGIHGFLMKVDDDLDTLWTELVDIFPGETYIFTHAWDGDGFILAGEHQEPGVGNGTFIAKVDTQGQYLWHTVLHESEEGSFRNRFISVVPEGYIVSGSQGGGADTEGQIEFIDTLTQEVYTFTNNESAISRGIMTHLVRENGVILVTQTVRLTDYPGTSNPFYAYSNSNLFRLDIDDLELELLQTYDGNGDWITPFIYKTIESSQDGLVQLGRTYLEIDDSLRQVSFIMKLTEDYQVDWYTELSYEICSGCNNELYDIEQAPDGGYVMVGKFNSPEDPYDKTWLVKVDACGDLEWQGCEPVGIGELEEQSSFNVYPNPVVDRLNIESQTNREWDEIRITDILGQEVIRETTANSIINIGELRTGLYMLTLNSKGLPIYSEKFLKE